MIEPDEEQHDLWDIRIMQSSTQFGDPVVFLAKVFYAEGKPVDFRCDGDEVSTVDEIRAALERPVLSVDDLEHV